MKSKIMFSLLVSLMTIISCGNAARQSNVAADEKTDEKAENVAQSVILTDAQVRKLGIVTDKLSKQPFSDLVETNGSLGVLPQDQASVTAVIGANVLSINVYEGQKVSKGQVLAYLRHPDLLNIQSKYMDAYNRLMFTTHEYERQKTLYSQNVGAGRDYQKVRSEYSSLRAEVRNLESQLSLLHINPARIRNGSFYQSVAVVSPINGYVDKIDAKTGQYLDPQNQMFSIINNNHVFADLMVYEKDVAKIKKGQKVLLTAQSLQGQTITARISSVGKTFEPNPKAVHVHALIDNKYNLISGMYIKGRILTGSSMAYSLPLEAIVEEDGKHYIFSRSGNTFTPMEVNIGMEEDGRQEVKLLSPVKDGTMIAQNNAYYLMSEMKKGETGEE